MKRQPVSSVGWQQRAGFTLVEMLVSVALVLLMMSLFASIFSMASGSVSTQRGISNHDQKARALTTLIKGDFSHRTNRYPLPFYPNENTATSPTPFGNRAGYLYISTNDPYSGQDDLVQFTVSADMLQEDTDSSPYYGRAALLNDPSGNTSTSLSVNPNQPEADDSSLTVNNTGSSTAAEVCYFVRNGNLYRRVMLLRQPLPVAGRELDEQPMTSRGQDYFTSGSGNFSVQTSAGAVATDDFWTYFDYSATAGSPTGKAQFVGLSALNNEQSRTVPAVANPAWRFGFNQFTGISREHAVLNGAFIGRFLHAETSAGNFNWPQRQALNFGTNQVFGVGNSPDGNPFNVANPLTLNIATGVVQEFSDTASGAGRGGARRMEDLVLSDVHELKVEIWDERLQKYTTPGHNELYRLQDLSGNTFTLPGDYHQGRRFADADGQGPEGSSIGVFDTWHPDTDPAVVGARHPPHIAYRYTPPVYPNGPTRPGLPVPPTAEPDRQTRRADNKGYWQPGTVYELGDVVFAPWVDAPRGANPPDSIFQYDEMPPQKFQVAYRCVGRQGSGTSHGSIPPGFPTAPGRRKRERNDELEWESIDNRRPLTSIRLTLRFHDQTSDTQRNLTLVLPLTDKK